ncbi:MAG: uridine kinase [Planctomycetota bacterium]|jgi:uridine kinase
MDVEGTARSILTVGIAGGTGSGKTTFARALRAALPPGSVALIDHDAYYRDLSHLEPDARAAVNFDDPASLESELLAEHLDALAAGQSIQKPTYDFAQHVRCAATETVDAAPVILVEGILVLAAPELRARFDLRLFVDAPTDIRLLRRIRRDIVERGRTIDGIAQQYIGSVRAMHDAFVAPSRSFADLVVPGDGDFSVALRIAADALLHRLRLG